MIRSIYSLLFFLFLLPAYASDGEFTKNYHKEYDVPKDATVELINKYGYVKVHTWEKRIASVDVNIIANTNSKSEADELFEKIQIQFTTTSNYIKAETVIQSTNKNWWDIRNWVGGWNKNSSYKINYDVYLPADLYLKLNHKYGDAFVDRLDRNAEVKMSYGNLRMDGLNADLDLELAYSDGNLGSIKRGHLNLRYSDVTLAEMEDGSLNFRYSEIDLNKAGTLKAESAYGELNAEYIASLDLQSRYDDIRVRSVGDFYVSSAYTDFDLGKVGKRTSFSSTYGDIIIRDLDADFQSLDLKTSYTDVRISTGGAPYRLDASGSYADIKTPSDFNSTYQVEKSNSKSVKGYSRAENTGGLIKATLSYGGLRVD